MIIKFRKAILVYKKHMQQVRIVIENVTPKVDCGRFATKARVGGKVEIAADIWKDGHELLKAAVLWRKLSPDELTFGAMPGAPDRKRLDWRESALSTDLAFNDRWFATISPHEVGPHAFTVVAWTDRFGSFVAELKERVAAGQDVSSELLEGLPIIDRSIDAAHGRDRVSLRETRDAIAAAKTTARQVELILDPLLAELMARCDPRDDLQICPAEFPLWVDRERGCFGAWYELFPRSQGKDPARGATLAEAEGRLPEIATMGFDVLYLAPIHPIGRSHRKGPNNSEECRPSDPGSPWAIGGEEGGHDAIHPELGTLADFDHFVAAARGLGLEIAMDFAVQCSPDHPWVKQHPDWFRKRPDGTIKYAENPPKKYQDIVPINFETEDRDGLYQALLDVVLFWVRRGIRIFRVDNPHTKPVSFWEWLIARTHRDHPDVLFLAEAFTRPKRMKRLAKLGFTQSYSYFTWRNSRQELEEYATELFLTDTADCLRPNFFANTPDILHDYLQKGGRPGFMVRLILAATLSPNYGIYSGFELCENRALAEGSEEYLDSEKYQHKTWDWDRSGNIKELVATVNRIRRTHPALALSRNLRFLESSNSNIIAYAKPTSNLADVLVMIVNLDPRNVQDGTVRLVPELFHRAERGKPLAGGVPASYELTDLLTESNYTWRGEWNYVRLDPNWMPAHILHVKPPRA
jgi:starch synthase (maltosyl-transferring)